MDEEVKREEGENRKNRERRETEVGREKGGKRRRKRERGRRTGPGTILKGLIKPAKCHAATHVPCPRSEKIRSRCSETKQLVYRDAPLFSLL